MHIVQSIMSARRKTRLHSVKLLMPLTWGQTQQLLLGGKTILACVPRILCQVCACLIQVEDQMPLERRGWPRQQQQRPHAPSHAIMMSLAGLTRCTSCRILHPMGDGITNAYSAR